MGQQDNKSEKSFAHSVIFRFPDMVTFSDVGILSKIVIKKEHGNITLFAFDKGQELSEHTTPYDALIQIAGGEARITIDGQDFHLESGENIISDCP